MCGSCIVRVELVVISCQIHPAVSRVGKAVKAVLERHLLANLTANMA